MYQLLVITSLFSGAVGIALLIRALRLPFRAIPPKQRETGTEFDLLETYLSCRR